MQPNKKGTQNHKTKPKPKPGVFNKLNEYLNKLIGRKPHTIKDVKRKDVSTEYDHEFDDDIYD